MALSGAISLKDCMATGKPRIFELAKELGMSSKDLLGLFGRLGLEAKNQLNVVEPKGAKAAPKAARAAAPAASVATAEPPATAPAAPAAPVAAEPAVAPAGAPAQAAAAPAAPAASTN